MKIKIIGSDTELIIGKSIQINSSKKEFFYLEKMNDGNFRITVTEGLIGCDLSEFQGFEIIGDKND